jgi:hypothetical protein
MAELHSLLDIIEEILPIGPIEWGTVVEQHKVLYEAKLRDLNSIRCKFNQMATKTAPTGDPNIPDYIRHAKDIGMPSRRKQEEALQIWMSWG